MRGAWFPQNTLPYSQLQQIPSKGKPTSADLIVSAAASLKLQETTQHENQGMELYTFQTEGEVDGELPNDSPIEKANPMKNEHIKICGFEVVSDMV